MMTICAFFTHLALYMFDHEQEEAALADVSAQVLIYSCVLTSHTHMYSLANINKTHSHARARVQVPFSILCLTCLLHMCDKTHFSSVFTYEIRLVTHFLALARRKLNFSLTKCVLSHISRNV